MEKKLSYLRTLCMMFRFLKAYYLKGELFSDDNKAIYKKAGNT